MVIEVETAEGNSLEDAIGEFRQLLEVVESRHADWLHTRINLNQELVELEQEKNLLNSNFEDFKLKIEKNAPRREELVERKLNYSQLSDEGFDREMDALSLGCDCEAIKQMAKDIKLKRDNIALLAYYKSLRKEQLDLIISQFEERISEANLMLNSLEE